MNETRIRYDTVPLLEIVISYAMMVLHRRPTLEG